MPRIANVGELDWDMNCKDLCYNVKPQDVIELAKLCPQKVHQDISQLTGRPASSEDIEKLALGLLISVYPAAIVQSHLKLNTHLSLSLTLDQPLDTEPFEALYEDERGTWWICEDDDAERDLPAGKSYTWHELGMPPCLHNVLARLSDYLGAYLLNIQYKNGCVEIEAVDCAKIAMIRSPSRFLAALARRMSLWASEA